ncbi:MAG: CerR family C-terminal domain-containing protein [Acidovorax sp.]
MKTAPRSPRTDGEATRARILEVAGERFAADGFAETTSKAIAAQAGVDLASINYHFGSRSGLYQAVLLEAHRRLVDYADLRQLADSPVPAADKLKALLGQLVQRATEDSEGWHLTVLAGELLAPSSHLEVLLQSEVPMKISLVIAILAEITGIPASDPALLRCLLSIVAPCLVLLISRRGLPGPLQEVGRMPRAAIVDHLHRFAIAGLEAIADEHARQRKAPAQ